MASTTLVLDGLPRSILTNVLDLLELRDLCNFCLVSRGFAARCRENAAFQKYFSTKTLKWTSIEQIQEFVHLTHENRMGCLIRNLRIVGAPATELQSLITLLAQAFTNLRLNSTHAGLQSVTLLVQVQVEDGDGNSELVSVA